MIVTYKRNGEHWLMLVKHPEQSKSWKVIDRHQNQIALVKDEALQAFCETMLIAVPELVQREPEFPTTKWINKTPEEILSRGVLNP